MISRVVRLVLPWPGLKKRVSSRSEEWSHFSVNVSLDFRCTRGMFCCCFQELHISWSFMLWIPTSRKFLLEQHVPCLIPTSNKHHGAGPNGRNAGVYSTTKLFGCLARRDFQVVDPWQKNGSCNWSTGCLTHLGPDPGKTGDWSKKNDETNWFIQFTLHINQNYLHVNPTCFAQFFCTESSFWVRNQIEPTCFGEHPSLIYPQIQTWENLIINKLSYCSFPVIRSPRNSIPCIWMYIVDPQDLFIKFAPSKPGILLPSPPAD